jgi:hypothetical protein
MNLLLRSARDPRAKLRQQHARPAVSTPATDGSPEPDMPTVTTQEILSNPTSSMKAMLTLAQTLNELAEAGLVTEGPLRLNTMVTEAVRGWIKDGYCPTEEETTEVMSYFYSRGWLGP